MAKKGDKGTKAPVGRKSKLTLRREAKKAEISALICPGSVEKLPEDILAQISRWYLDKASYTEISRNLKTLGYHVIAANVARYCKAHFQATVAIRDLPTVADDDERIKIERAAIYGLLDLCIESWRGMVEIPSPKTIQDMDKLANAVTRLTTASVQRERLEIEKNAVIERVQEEFRKSLEADLAGHPELVAQIVEIVDSVANKMLQ